MKKRLAIVLGGGGARGAMQVGALRALLEEGLKPDLLVGTSIGAINAAGLALWGMNIAGIQKLEHAYQRMQESKLLDPRLFQFAWNAVERRDNHCASRAARELLIAAGIASEFRFGQIRDVCLATVAADLHTGEPLIYGLDPEQSVLDGVIASIAIPPWFAPIEIDGRYVVDGGALSNVPIQPALDLGATEIIALNLQHPDINADAAKVPGPLPKKLAFATLQRQLHLEMELASARGVSVRHVSLRSIPSVPLWDFRTHRDLFKIGYDTMQNEMSRWSQNSQPKWNFLRLFTREQPSRNPEQIERVSHHFRPTGNSQKSEEKITA
jgi:NTE family protein